MKKDDAIFNVLREYIKHSKKILLKETVTVKHGEGWKRGLSNFKTTPEALKARASKTSFRFVFWIGIMNHVEVEARYEIEWRVH
jgi:glutamine synthetase